MPAIVTVCPSISTVAAGALGEGVGGHDRPRRRRRSRRATARRQASELGGDPVVRQRLADHAGRRGEDPRLWHVQRLGNGIGDRGDRGASVGAGKGIGVAGIHQDRAARLGGFSDLGLAIQHRRRAGGRAGEDPGHHRIRAAFVSHASCCTGKAHAGNGGQRRETARRGEGRDGWGALQRPPCIFDGGLDAVFGLLQLFLKLRELPFKLAAPDLRLGHRVPRLRISPTGSRDCRSPIGPSLQGPPVRWRRPPRAARSLPRWRPSRCLAPARRASAPASVRVCRGSRSA
jgi:hypothetical protein